MRALTLQEFTAQEIMVDAFVHQSAIWAMFYQKFEQQITDEQRQGVITDVQKLMPIQSQDHWLVVDNIRKSCEREPQLNDLAKFIKRCYPRIYFFGKIK